MKGQSLVELLVGIAIGAIFIVGAATIIAPSLQIGKESSQAQTQTELASELLDNVKAWAAGSWDNVLELATGTANTYYLSTATSSFAVEGSGTIVTIVTSTITTADTISFVQATSSNDSSGAGSHALTFAHVNSGDAIIAADLIGTVTSSMSDTLGSSWNLAVRYKVSVTGTGGSGFQTLEIWYATNTGSGADTVRFTHSGSTYFVGGIAEYSGLATSSVVDVTSDNTGSGSSMTSGAATITNANDLIVGIGGNVWSDNTFTAGSGFAGRWSQSGGNQSAMYEDQVVSSTQSIAAIATAGTSFNYSMEMAAFEADGISTVTTSTIAVVSGGVIEPVVIGGVPYTRYFYLNDVYRDSNGNVTTTATGNSYDPSTKFITIIVRASSTQASPTTTLSFYLTRNGNNSFNQTSWLGGSGQSNPVTVVGTNYAGSSNITVSATGSIQLSSGGGSCIL